MIRGIERGEIVGGVKDRKAFIERMGALAVDTGTKIYAWALMANHAHILPGNALGWWPKTPRLGSESGACEDSGGGSKDLDGRVRAPNRSHHRGGGPSVETSE